MPNNKQTIFQEIDGLWLAVDSAYQTSSTLAETLKEYRAYNGKVRINITQSKE